MFEYEISDLILTWIFSIAKKISKKLFDPREASKKIYQSETNFQKSKKSSPNKIYIHTKNWRFIIILDYINT